MAHRQMNRLENNLKESYHKSLEYMDTFYPKRLRGTMWMMIVLEKLLPLSSSANAYNREFGNDESVSDLIAFILTYTSLQPFTDYILPSGQAQKVPEKFESLVLPLDDTISESTTRKLNYVVLCMCKMATSLLYNGKSSYNHWLRILKNQVESLKEIE